LSSTAAITALDPALAAKTTDTRARPTVTIATSFPPSPDRRPGRAVKIDFSVLQPYSEPAAIAPITIAIAPANIGKPPSVLGTRLRGRTSASRRLAGSPAANPPVPVRYATYGSRYPKTCASRRKTPPRIHVAGRLRSFSTSARQLSRRPVIVPPW
jgi:hypothetical protein